MWASDASSPLPPPLDAKGTLFSSITIEYAPTHGRYSINESRGGKWGANQKKNFKNIIKDAMKDLTILWQYSGTDDIF